MIFKIAPKYGLHMHIGFPLPPREVSYIFHLLVAHVVLGWIKKNQHKRQSMKNMLLS